MYEELVKRLRWAASYDERIVIQDAKDAADAIEDLEKCLAIALLEYQTANNKRLMTEEYVKQKHLWIPVNERLPENEEFVIVTVKDERGDYPYIYSDFGWYFDKAECWIVENEKRNDITHWMPLPEPSKENRK